MRRIHLIFVSIAVASAVAIGGVAAARTPFDGNWSVLVLTDRGECDRGYRYEIRVDNGTVSFRGEEAVEVSGRVEPGGTVKVDVSRGEHRASGTGQLLRDSGTGVWRGKSRTGECSGTWTAERR